jgi:hypothetical protein
MKRPRGPNPFVTMGCTGGRAMSRINHKNHIILDRAVRTALVSK